MRVKQFLKPDWKKISAFVIFLILYLIGVFYVFVFMEYVPKPSWLLVFDVFMMILALPMYIFQILFPVMEFEIGILIIIVAYSLLIIYWYLLSCLIVWIYDKVKKKK